jgi:hypothetical protein
MAATLRKYSASGRGIEFGPAGSEGEKPFGNNTKVSVLHVLAAVPACYLPKLTALYAKSE